MHSSRRYDNSAWRCGRRQTRRRRLPERESSTPKGDPGRASPQRGRGETRQRRHDISEAHKKATAHAGEAHALERRRKAVPCEGTLAVYDDVVVATTLFCQMSYTLTLPERPTSAKLMEMS